MQRARLFESVSRALDQLSNPSASLLPALGIALTIAKQLGDAEHEYWLDNEFRGYGKRKLATTLGEALKTSSPTALSERVTDYRTIKAHFFVPTPQGIPETWPYPVFVPNSISDIEAVCSRTAADSQLNATTKVPAELLARLREFVVLPHNSINIHFTRQQYAKILSEFKLELITYLTTAQMRLAAGESDMEKEPKNATVNTGNINAKVVNIVNSSDGTMITIGDPMKIAGAKAIAQLREEVSGIQDLLIGSHKQHLEFAEHAAITKEALLKIIELIEQKVGDQQVDDQHLLTIAQGAVADALRTRLVEPSILRRLVSNGVSQSLIASVIFEAIKAAPDIIALLG